MWSTLVPGCEKTGHCVVNNTRLWMRSKGITPYFSVLNLRIHFYLKGKLSRARISFRNPPGQYSMATRTIRNQWLLFRVNHLIKKPFSRTCSGKIIKWILEFHLIVYSHPVFIIAKCLAPLLSLGILNRVDKSVRLGFDRKNIKILVKSLSKSHASRMFFFL